MDLFEEVAFLQIHATAASERRLSLRNLQFHPLILTLRPFQVVCHGEETFHQSISLFKCGFVSIDGCSFIAYVPFNVSEHL